MSTFCYTYQFVWLSCQERQLNMRDSRTWLPISHPVRPDPYSLTFRPVFLLFRQVWHELHIGFLQNKPELWERNQYPAVLLGQPSCCCRSFAELSQLYVSLLFFFFAFVPTLAFELLYSFSQYLFYLACMWFLSTETCDNYLWYCANGHFLLSTSPRWQWLLHKLCSRGFITRSHSSNITWRWVVQFADFHVTISFKRGQFIDLTN